MAEPRNMLGKPVDHATSHEFKSWLNARADSKLDKKLRQLDKSQLESGWLKELASLNIRYIDLTLDVSQVFRAELKLVLP